MDQIYPFGPFVFDVQRRILSRQGSTIAMGQRCLVLLETLLAADGRAVSKSELIEAAWKSANIEESNLPVQIATLRKRLGTTPHGGQWIATVQRVGYQFINPVNAPKTRHNTAIVSSLHEKPTVAVLPLVNLSSDPEQNYFCDAMTEDIIIELTRRNSLTVRSRSASFRHRNTNSVMFHIASELSVRYVVEGSVRRIGERMRISVELIDALNDNEIWAENFDRAFVVNFSTQDQLVRTIVTTLVERIQASVMERLSFQLPGDLRAR